MSIGQFLEQYVLGVVVASLIAGFIGGFFAKARYDLYRSTRESSERNIQYRITVKGEDNVINIHSDSYNPYDLKEKGKSEDLPQRDN